MARNEKPAPTLRLHLRVEGWGASDWSERFDGITVRLAEDGSTVLCGELRDQAVFFGILRFVESRGAKVIACLVYPGGAA